MRLAKANKQTFSSSGGFSLVELIMSLLLSLLILGVAVATFSGALGSRDRESSRTDAITSAQAALNVMTREIGNAGYGLVNSAGLPFHGIVTADSNANQLHFRANIDNVGTGGGNGTNTNQAGEDITYYCETCNGSTTGSVVRSDRNVNGGAPSGIINRVSDVDFAYFDVNPTTCVVSTTALTAPTDYTVKVRITLIVILPEARRQPLGQQQRLTSDVTLRNSTCMLQQY
jgi:Tfp pilus assembly protein PilW